MLIGFGLEPILDTVQAASKIVGRFKCCQKWLENNNLALFESGELQSLPISLYRSPIAGTKFTDLSLQITPYKEDEKKDEIILFCILSRSFLPKRSSKSKRCHIQFDSNWMWQHIFRVKKVERESSGWLQRVLHRRCLQTFDIRLLFWLKWTTSTATASTSTTTTVTVTATTTTSTTAARQACFFRVENVFEKVITSKTRKFFVDRLQTLTDRLHSPILILLTYNQFASSFSNEIKL